MITQKVFFQICSAHSEQLLALEEKAIGLHQSVNQMYENRLPYAYHLVSAAAYVGRYGFEMVDKEDDVLLLYAGAYFHDAIEDARQSYNDIVKSFSDLLSPLLAKEAADIVYALTNEKGKNRLERASESYYKLIRETRFAPFIKMCDRLSNISFNTRFGSNRMTEIYRNELEHFLFSLKVDGVYPFPEKMVEEMREHLFLINK